MSDASWGSSGVFRAALHPPVNASMHLCKLGKTSKSRGAHSSQLEANRSLRETSGIRQLQVQNRACRSSI